MSTYYPDEREESSRLIGELNATINEQAEEIERLQAERRVGDAQAPEWVMPALLEHVQELGCRCEKPLLGYSPGYGPRCRLCNVDAEDQQKQEKARADALQQLIFAKDDALLAAHARVRELEEERDNSLEGWRQANNRIRSQMKRITQLEEALRGLRTMVVNVLTDSQLDHVNCGQTIRNALGPVDALLSPDDGSQP
jgi:hypothetical protein